MSLDELKHDRPALYESLEKSGELAQHLVDPPTAAFSRVVRVFGLTALVVGFTLVGLILYGLLSCV
jgi:multisubunit Na+/H+ antiporter MnhC subunit